MKRSFIVAAWWDGHDQTESRNGYNPQTEESHAVFRIGKLHFYWGTEGEA